MIALRCSRSGPSVTGTWAGCAPRWPAGCTRCCASWCPAACPARSPQARPPGSWSRSHRRGRWTRPAGELAAELTEDLRGTDARIRETRKKAAAAVAAAGTSLTGLFGVGPVIAAAVIGDVRHVSRFPDRDHFAAYNGTAPVEVSSGQRKLYRLSRRGNRRLNHAIHMAAVTQVSHPHSPGREYYDRKIAEGKTGKEALRSLKRRISDVIYAALVTDARQQPKAGPGGQTGNVSNSSATGSHPATPALRTSHSRTHTKPTTSRPSRSRTTTTTTRKKSRLAS